MSPSSKTAFGNLPTLYISAFNCRQSISRAAFWHTLRSLRTFVLFKNKYSLMRTLLFCLLSSCYVASFAQKVDEKLVAFFSFGECKALDESGNGSTGAFVGDPACRCGVLDSAIAFDGVGDAIFFVGPLSDVFSLSDFTISFYLKPGPVNPNAGGSQVILSKQESCNPDAKALWVRYNPKSRKISSGLVQNQELFVTVTGDLDPTACWQHIALVRNNTSYSLYVNGELKDRRTTTVRIDLTSGAIFKVGEPICLLDQPFFGDFDELRVYSRALTQDDVRALYVRPDRILTNDTILYLGNALQVLTNPTCTQNLNWAPADGVSEPNGAEPILTPTVSTLYRLSFLHEGCTAYDTLRVTVIDPDTLDCNLIFLPNAFTPTSSPGRNDVFAISNPYVIDDFISFEVFDRWGGRVFAAASVFDGWDGTFQGQPLNAGIFLYRLRYRCKGEERTKSGTVTLLR